jgi:hypothetical protein
VQVAVQAPPEHAIFGPQAMAPPQSVHPVGMVAQVWTLVPEHWVAPTEH